MKKIAARSALASAVALALGAAGTALAPVASAAILADGLYDMVINNTPYSTTPYGGYGFGSDGAWNTSFTTGCLPGSKGCFSTGLYDDTLAQPVHGQYAGNPNDGRQGTISIMVVGGVITGTGIFEFDTVMGTVGGAFAEYTDTSVQPVNFSGSIDAAGNISFTPTGLLGTFGDFPTLVDERWNVDNFNGYAGTTLVPNPPNSNTAWDSFSTGTATNGLGTINGAAYDGTTAILVKAGTYGSDWQGFTGVSYFEAWNVSFVKTGDLPTIPIPAAAWLFGSGLLGLVGVAARRKS